MPSLGATVLGSYGGGGANHPGAGGGAGGVLDGGGGTVPNGADTWHVITPAPTPDAAGVRTRFQMAIQFHNANDEKCVVLIRTNDTNTGGAGAEIVRRIPLQGFRPTWVFCMETDMYVLKQNVALEASTDGTTSNSVEYHSYWMDV